MASSPGSVWLPTHLTALTFFHRVGPQVFTRPNGSEAITIVSFNDRLGGMVRIVSALVCHHEGLSLVNPLSRMNPGVLPESNRSSFEVLCGFVDNGPDGFAGVESIQLVVHAVIDPEHRSLNMLVRIRRA